MEFRSTLKTLVEMMIAQDEKFLKLPKEKREKILSEIDGYINDQNIRSPFDLLDPAKKERLRMKLEEILKGDDP